MSTNSTKRIRTNQSRDNLYKIVFLDSKYDVYYVSTGILSAIFRDKGTSKNIVDGQQ